MIKVITEANFKDNTSEGLILLKFGTPWCNPCRAVDAALTEIACDRGDITITEVDTDESPELASQFKIRRIPSIFILKEGQVVDQFTGIISKKNINKMIDINL